MVGFSVYTEVGFYNYLALKECILKGMNKNLSTSSPLPSDPPSKSALLGQFHHKVMELVSKCVTRTDLVEAIEVAISNLQLEVDHWPHLKAGSVSGWDEVNYYAIAAQKSFLKKDPNNNVTVLGSERTLYSFDKLLLGRPDHFTIADGNAKLKELKTSSLNDDENKIREEYVEQILFYSVLLFDNYKVSTVYASLESPRSEKYEREISKDQAESFRKIVTDKIYSANKLIKSAGNVDQLAKPSKAACETCQKKYICNPFKADQLNLNLEKDNYVLEGEIKTITNDDSQKISVIVVLDKYKGGTQKIVVPTNYVEELKVGDKCFFSHLTLQGGELRWGNKSRIFNCA